LNKYPDCGFRCYDLLMLNVSSKFRFHSEKGSKSKSSEMEDDRSSFERRKLSNCFLVISQHKKVRIFDIKFGKEIDCLVETDLVSNCEISIDGRFLLVNNIAHEIHLWDLPAKKILQKYRGHVQTRYFIGSCFGGAHQNFVVCGSEDSQVYIWHRVSGVLLTTLSGHSGCVNSVCWNPKNPKLFASCSDDHTIRLWM